MAHNLNYNEARNTYSFYTLKEIPWHGLGQIVQDVVDPIEALRLANLDYEVKLADMYASFIPSDASDATQIADNVSQILTADGRSYQCPTATRVPEVFATYRTDNFNVLGTVGKRYEIVQNQAALDFIYNIIQHNDIIDSKDIIIQTAGALGKGERIFVTAKLPSDVISINGDSDPHDNYIVFTTSHDGSSSIQAMFTSIRVVCNNTLNAAIGSAKNILSFRHTKNVKDSLRAGADIMRSQLRYNAEKNLLLTESALVTVNDEDVLRYIGNVFISNVAERKHFIDATMAGKSLDPNIVSSRRVNVLNSVFHTIHNGVGQDVAKNTAYWLYNGVTSYLNNTIDYASQEDKLNSFIKGSSYKTGQLALNALIELAS